MTKAETIMEKIALSSDLLTRASRKAASMISTSPTGAVADKRLRQTLTFADEIPWAKFRESLGGKTLKQKLNIVPHNTPFRTSKTDLWGSPGYGHATTDAVTAQSKVQGRFHGIE